MPLLNLWASDPDTVRELTIEQVVANAGDGRLRDGSECQHELQAFVKQVSVEDLSRYADHCLESSFNHSGQVLQDIVNELGRRLEYDVENGRYQGTKNAIGFDGIWRDPSGQSLVVEVKTTDTYRLSLDTVEGYRNRLRVQGAIGGDSSILVVVGRTDTGELEAQVRGSRHAWDIRLISVDALFKLVTVKQNADSQDTVAKTRRLLTPAEYTRLDELVDVVFSAAQDIETAAATEGGSPNAQLEGEEDTKGAWQFTPVKVIQTKRDSIVKAVSQRLGASLIKRSRASYWDADHEKRLVCTISKRYENRGVWKYWYAYHQPWDEFLSAGDNSYYALGCVDLDIAFLLPLSVVQEHLDDFNITVNKNGPGHYYHIKILEPAPGVYELQLPKAEGNMPLNEYVLALVLNPDADLVTR